MANEASLQRFDAVVEAADHLTQEEQQTLIEVLTRRLANRRRDQIVSDIEEAQREFQNGALCPATPQRDHERHPFVIGEPPLASKDPFMSNG